MSEDYPCICYVCRKPIVSDEPPRYRGEPVHPGCTPSGS